MLSTLSLLVATASAVVLTERDVSGRSIVHLDEKTGAPQHWASGFIYGLPEAQGQIPSHFLTNMGFWNMRTGGAQLPEPSRGWTHGYDEFMVRTLECTARKIPHLRNRDVTTPSFRTTKSLVNTVPTSSSWSMTSGESIHTPRWTKRLLLETTTIGHRTTNF